MVWLYPPAQTEPQHQAEALLQTIQTHCEHAVGSYVPASNLERFYGDLAKERGWTPRSWHVIGRELGKLTQGVPRSAMAGPSIAIASRARSELTLRPRQRRLKGGTVTIAIGNGINLCAGNRYHNANA